MLTCGAVTDDRAAAGGTPLRPMPTTSHGFKASDERFDRSFQYWGHKRLFRNATRSRRAP